MSILVLTLVVGEAVVDWCPGVVEGNLVREQGEKLGRSCTYPLLFGLMLKLGR